jgi:hypothetical protein
MSWPDDLTKISTNLPQEEFTVLKFAIDHELVEWCHGSSLVMSLGTCPLIFNGREYILKEIYEEVTSLNRKE